VVLSSKTSSCPCPFILDKHRLRILLEATNPAWEEPAWNRKQSLHLERNLPWQNRLQQLDKMAPSLKDVWSKDAVKDKPLGIVILVLAVALVGKLIIQVLYQILTSPRYCANNYRPDHIQHILPSVGASAWSMASKDVEVLSYSCSSRPPQGSGKSTVTT
jgi:hypothetical protein